MDDWLSANQAMWNERVPLHVASDFYDVRGFVAGRPQLQPFEIDELGPLDSMSLLHLQCHFGLDSLDIARLHPTVAVTGLDFSAPAIEAATRLADEVRLSDRARFVFSDVYRAPATLSEQRFDVVYTGKGALNWLPDIDRWAAVVHELLKPGGFLYLAEFHPVVFVLGEDEPLPKYDYFTTEPFFDETPGSYVDRHAATLDNASYEWQHPISRIMTAILQAGLRLELFHEWDFTLFDQFPWLVKGPDGRGRWPGPGSLPLMYSLKAVRPDG